AFVTAAGPVLGARRLIPIGGGRAIESGPAMRTTPAERAAAAGSIPREGKISKEGRPKRSGQGVGVPSALPPPPVSRKRSRGSDLRVVATLDKTAGSSTDILFRRTRDRALRLIQDMAGDTKPGSPSATQGHGEGARSTAAILAQTMSLPAPATSATSTGVDIPLYGSDADTGLDGIESYAAVLPPGQVAPEPDAPLGLSPFPLPYLPPQHRQGQGCMIPLPIGLGRRPLDLIEILTRREAEADASFDSDGHTLEGTASGYQ
ncbi:hypothetical protein KIPB_009508, partial [Kipferlia bialata]